MDPESGILSESVLFEAREATSASSSSSYYSSRIHAWMKLKSERGMSEKDAEIEAAKTHWTEVESNRYYTPATSGREESCTSETGGESCRVEMTEEWAELYKENVEEMRRLQMQNVKTDFFQIGGKVVGEMIAKGGQGIIYDHSVKTKNGWSRMVLKVFKAGYSVGELRKQWPADLLKHFQLDRTILFDFMVTPIWNGRLLDDGRFAFQMMKYWGDVRKLLDVRMEHNGNRYPPFMMEDGSYQQRCIFKLWSHIAKGMKALHGEGILHKDLKASNVLIETLTFFTSGNEKNQLNPLKLGDEEDVYCVVADYECSIGIVGTGFWKVPEILDALKNWTSQSTRNVCTPQVDIYSYAMTCYEILTGPVPFEHPEDEGTNVDHVLQGRRPTLLQHLEPWVMKLFHECWHPNPLERPTFIEIVKLFHSCEQNLLLPITKSFHS